MWKKQADFCALKCKKCDEDKTIFCKAYRAKCSTLCLSSNSFMHDWAKEFMVVPTVKKWETGKGSSLESCLQHCTHGYCHLFHKGLPNTISYQYWGANCCWAALWGISKWNSTYKSAWVFWKLKLRERHMWGRSTSVCFCLQTIMAQQLNQILDCQYA